MVTVELKRVEGDFGFEIKDLSGHITKMDTAPSLGGTDFGARPMQVLLMSLGSCSGIDIISILKKQRQEITEFSATITGERNKEKVPSLWKNVHIIFRLWGDIDPNKAAKACELSIEKYCSVAETLRLAGCVITWEVQIN